MAGGSTPTGGSPSTSGTVESLLAEGRFEDAAALAHGLPDLATMADVLLTTRARTAFLDVDLALVRLLEDVLGAVDQANPSLWARLAAKLALETRGDPASADRRRALLEEATLLAHEAGDDVAMGEVLHATINALWEPGDAAARLDAAERTITLTRRAHELDRELEARVARLQALVELGRIAAAELELATYARLIEALDRTDLRMFVASRRCMFAMIHGQLDDMVRYGEQAYEHAIEAEMPDAQRLATVHTLSVALDRTGTEMDQAIETNLTVFTGLAAALPGQYFEAHMAVCLLALGRRDQARAHLALALPSLLSTYEAAWHIAACSAADVAAEVGSDEVCGRVYEALLLHRGQYAVLGPLFRGSVRHRLGVLALRLGRLDIAIDDLRRTVEDFDGMPALSWAARARVDLAAALRARGDDEAAVRHLAAAREIAEAIGMTRLLPRIAILEKNAGTTWLLRRDGEDWELQAGTERVRVRGSRGMDHLRLLLADPGRDMPALELMTGDPTIGASPGIEILDGQATSAYRRRIAQIDDELDTADRTGDEGRAAVLDLERRNIIAELSRATGLGGRIRTTNDAAERARINVTRNVKRAIGHLARHAPTAAAHLTASIRTGTYCGYYPGPGGPDHWQF